MTDHEPRQTAPGETPNGTGEGAPRDASAACGAIAPRGSMAAPVVEYPGQPSETGCACVHRVSLYFDGELTEGERRDVEEHLATCPTCAAALSFFGRVSGAFAATAPARLEPGSRERLRSLIAGGGVTVAAGGLPARGVPARGVPAHVRWVRRLTAVAAVLFVVAICRLAYRHYSPAGPDVTPAVHNQLVPENVPSTTGQQRFTAPDDGRWNNDPRPSAGKSPSHAPTAPATPEYAPSTAPTLD